MTIRSKPPRMPPPVERSSDRLPVRAQRGVRSSEVAPAPGQPAAEPALADEQVRLLDERAAEFAGGSRANQTTTTPDPRSNPIAVRADLLAGRRSATEETPASALDDALGEINSVYMWTRPPSSAEPEEPGTGGFSVDAEGRSGSATLGVAGPDRERSISPSLDRFGIGLDLSDLRPRSEHAAGVYVMRGYAELSGGANLKNADGTSHGSSAGVFWEPGGGGLTGSLSRTTLDGVTLRLGGFGGGSIQRNLIDHGDYSGAEPTLVGSRCVEMKRELSGYGVALPGLADGFGIAGRIGLAKGSSVSYTTHLARDQARALLFEGGNFLTKAIRDRSRALGISDEPLPPPNLAHLDEIKVGDSVTLTTEGSLSGGLVVGVSMAGYLGAQGTARGEFELSVQRPAANLLRVAVVPTKVKAIQISGRSIVFDATASRSNARAMAQSFEFDLSRPSAVAAYQALLKGELPGGGDTKSVRSEQPERPLAHGEVLPAGVTRISTERIAGHAVRYHADVGFLMLKLGATRNRSEFDQSIERDGVRFDERIAAVDRCRTIPLSGDETQGVRSSIVRATSYATSGEPTTEFLGMRLVSYINDTKARGLELNSDIDDINHAFGTTIGHFREKSLKQARSIELVMVLRAAELAELAELPEAAASAAAAAAGVPSDRLCTLIQRLRSEREPYQRALEVQAFISRNGFAGAGALARLVGIDHLAIGTVNGDLTSRLEQAAALLFKYEQPIAPHSSGDQLVTRFKEVEKLDSDLVKLRALVADDPLLAADQRTSALRDVDAAHTALGETLRLDHLDRDQRRALVDKLERGWVTGTESRIIEALERAGGQDSTI